MKSARLRRQCCKWVLSFNLSQISLLSLPQKSHYEVNANIFDLFPVYAAVSAHTWILKKKPLMYYEPLTSTNGFNSLRKKVLAEKKRLGRNYGVYVRWSSCNNVAEAHSTGLCNWVWWSVWSEPYPNVHTIAAPLFGRKKGLVSVKITSSGKFSISIRNKFNFPT